jgi:hypothetical protein
MRKTALLILLGCMHTPAIWAQCWDGTSMNGPVACPPPPNVPSSPVYKGNGASLPSPTVWESRWGAIAVDEKTGHVGVIANQNSKSDAQKTALQQCINNSGINCKIVSTYSNQCIAVAEKPGGGGWNARTASEISAAENNAINTCEKYINAKCDIRYSACSLPVKIQ